MGSMVLSGSNAMPPSGPKDPKERHWPRPPSGRSFPAAEPPWPRATHERYLCEASPARPC